MSIKRFRLYIILDRELLGKRDIRDAAQEIISAGDCLIQYRDKISPKKEILENARVLVHLNIPLIVNDYPDIALEAGALGVHLGQEDMDIRSARSMLGNSMIIGKSTHGIHQAEEAQMEGANYIGLGPVFATDTKKNMHPIGLDVLKDAAERISIPVFAIGGIGTDNVRQVIDCGINRTACAGAVLGADSITKAVRELKEMLEWKTVH